MGAHLQGAQPHEGPPRSCQENKSHIRTDAPTGSRDALYLTLAAAAQSGWDLTSYDAMTAYL
eukprot:60195-Pyramimonas_sp.AAC.1